MTFHCLILTPALPYPAHQGGALRNLGILYSLWRAGHRLTLLSFHDAPTITATSPLHRYCAYIETVPLPARRISDRLRDLFTSGKPDIARRLESPVFAHRLRDLLAKHRFDIVQFEGLEMATYLPIVRGMQPQARCIYDAHNAEYALQRQIALVERQQLRRLPTAAYSLIQSRRIAHWEQVVCRAVDGVIAVSEEDARQLAPFREDRCIHVLANGIFVDEYADTRGEAVVINKQSLVFTGKMDYRPNVDAMLWFVEAILPGIRARAPDARLVIVGQKPAPAIQALDAHDGVDVTGWVASVLPFLQDAAVYIAPLRMGSGTRLKLLEALAAGCPIVATSTAAAGMDEATRAVISIADTPDSFAERVFMLLTAPYDTTAREQRRAAVKQTYDWDALAPRLNAIYEAINA